MESVQRLMVCNQCRVSMAAVSRSLRRGGGAGVALQLLGTKQQSLSSLVKFEWVSRMPGVVNHVCPHKLFSTKLREKFCYLALQL